MRSRWLVLPASRRLWIMSGLIIMLLLAPFMGGTRYWTPTYVSIIFVAFGIAQIIWVRGRAGTGPMLQPERTILPPIDAARRGPSRWATRSWPAEGDPIGL